ETSTDDDTRKRDEDHIAMTALLALRIKMSCEIMRSNQSGSLKQINEDIKKLLSNVQRVEYEWEISDAVRNDAYDLLQAICLPEDQAIIAQSYSWNLQDTADEEITAEMFFLFIKIAEYLRYIGLVSIEISFL